MKKLVAIMTCRKPAYVAKAMVQRETWVKDVRRFADVVFFHGYLGRPFNPLADEIQLDAPGNYSGAAQRVRAMCQWAHAQGYEQTLKLDDDVFVIPRRLETLTTMGHNYVGRFRGPHGIYPAHFASGFAYWLGRRAMEIVSKTPWNGDWMDERFVANALALHGIFGYNDSSNYLVTGPHVAPDALARMWPLGTVYCEYGPRELRQLYDLLGNAGPLYQPPTFDVVPSVKITDKQFATPPRDGPSAEKLSR